MTTGETKKAVRDALRALGYDGGKGRFTMREIAPGRYEIRCGRSYIGIYDTDRKTFVD